MKFITLRESGCGLEELCREWTSESTCIYITPSKKDLQKAVETIVN